MQLRLNDVTVNDIPRFLTEKPTPLTHALVIPTDDFDYPYVIPMSLHGVSSTFPTRKPTMEEYKTLPNLVLTREEPRYNPHDPLLARHEEALAKAVLETGGRIGGKPPRRLKPMFGFQNFARCFWLRQSSVSIDADLDRPRRRCTLRYNASKYLDRPLCVSRSAANLTGPSNQLRNRCEDSRKDSPSNHAKVFSHSTPPDAVSLFLHE
jgi:hypothetical protein